MYFIKDQKNISVKINNCNYVNKRKKKNSSSYKGCKLFLSKD